jgi:hypothetical protein
MEPALENPRRAIDIDNRNDQGECNVLPRVSSNMRSVLVLLIAVVGATQTYAADVLCPKDDVYLTGADQAGTRWLYRHAGYLEQVNIIYDKKTKQTQFVCTAELGNVQRFIPGKCRFIANGGEVKSQEYGNMTAEYCKLERYSYSSNYEQCRVVCG